MMKMNRRALIAMAAAMAAGPVLGQETTVDPVAEPAAPVVTDYSLGSAEAPVKIVEYASFTCPHCASFHAEVFNKLKAEYIDTGKVQFTLREVYFDRYGLWAAMMARCGGEMKYFGITDILFSTQAKWAGTDDPAVAVQNLRTIGLSAGLTEEQLDACMNDAAMADALVKQFQEHMEADQVEGTPTLFVNGEKHPNMSWEDLKAIIDAKLAG